MSSRKQLFTFFWDNGKKSTGRGRDTKEAFVESGYPLANFKHVVYTDEGDSNRYVWSRIERKWFERESVPA